MGNALANLVVKLAVKYPVVAHLRPSPTGDVEHVDAYWRRYGTKHLGGGIQMPGRSSSNDLGTTRALMRTSPHYLPRLREKATGTRDPNGISSVTPSLGRVRPSVDTTDYVSLPFLAELHRRMGVDTEFTTVGDYAARRNALFEREGSMLDVPFHGLITTQRTAAGAGDDGLTPLVGQYQGRFYLLHGHDRAVFDAQAGMPVFKAFVVNFDRSEFRLDKEPWEHQPRTSWEPEIGGR